jgi:hypothetical protein
MFVQAWRGLRAYRRDDSADIPPLLPRGGRQVVKQAFKYFFCYIGYRISLFRMFIPDPGSEFFPISDPNRVRIKEFKYFNPKIVFKLSEI